MNPFFRITVVDDPSDELREAVYLPLRTHNQSSSPIHWAARELPENDPLPLSLFAHAEDGTPLGGLIGTTSFSWLKVDLMATSEDHRGRGIGRTLLAQAEEIARERGCKYAFTDTMEYQAPGFYQKVGYRIVGEIDDWDSHGHKKFFFKKDLL